MASVTCTPSRGNYVVWIKSHGVPIVSGRVQCAVRNGEDYAEGTEEKERRTERSRVHVSAEWR